MSNIKNGKKGKPIREKDGAVEKGPVKEKEEGSTGSNFKGDQLSPDEDIRPTGPLKDSKGGDSAGRYLQQNLSDLDNNEDDKKPAGQEAPAPGPELVVNHGKEPPPDRKLNKPENAKPKKKEPVTPPPRVDIQKEINNRVKVQQKDDNDGLGNRIQHGSNTGKNQYPPSLKNSPHSEQSYTPLASMILICLIALLIVRFKNRSTGYAKLDHSKE